jgi:hypothetical protein
VSRITHAHLIVAPDSHALISMYHTAESTTVHLLTDSFALIPLFEELFQSSLPLPLAS